MKKNIGKVIQIIGPVLDIRFENGQLPDLLGAIEIEHEGKKVNAKSIMGMMSLGLNAGETVSISADGADEEAAVNELEQYLCEA